MTLLDREIRDEAGYHPYQLLLRERREALGLSLTDLEHRSGITRRYIHRLERHPGASCTVRVLLALAAALELPASDLLNEFQRRAVEEVA